MAERYCAFLRGVNVNGISIKMDALKAAFIDMGFQNVKTILATGNVIFSDAEEHDPGQDIKASIEKALSGRFGYDAHIFMRSKAQIQAMLLAARTITVPEEHHHYCLLCDDTPLPLELKELFYSMPHISQEQFIAHEAGTFWIVPKGSTLSSDFGAKILGSKKYKSLLTSRNMNTMEKIFKAMAD